MKEKDEHRCQPAGCGRDKTVPEVDRFYRPALISGSTKPLHSILGTDLFCQVDR